MDYASQFNRLPWHDSKLLGIQIRRSSEKDSDEVVCDVLLRGEQRGKYNPVKIEFTDCAVVRLDMDLIGKRMCSDDIAEAACLSNSELMQRILSERTKAEQNWITGTLHYQIMLVQPGGTIDIFASGFQIH